MPRDVIDYQAAVRERVRVIEVTPGPTQLKVTPAWDPAYDDTDFLTFVSYCLIPFGAFQPGHLPAIPPQCQYANDILRTYGFPPPVNYHSRAWLRGMLNAGALQLPPILRNVKDQGNMTVRVEGNFTAADGPGVWHRFPNARFVEFRAMQGAANPAEQADIFVNPPDHLNQEWRSAGDGTYDAYLGGSPVQVVANHALALNGEPCDESQIPNAQWVIASSGLGISITRLQSTEPWCIFKPPRAPNPDLTLTTNPIPGSYWLLYSAKLTPTAGLYLTDPPKFYENESVTSVIRNPLHDVVVWPGFNAWKALVQTTCLSDPEWAHYWIYWYENHWPGHRAPPLNAAGANRHWQRVPLYLPWTGDVQYRIWAGLLYLRGNVQNPYYWDQQRTVFPFPPGAVPVSQGRGQLLATADTGNGSGGLRPVAVRASGSPPILELFPVTELGTLSGSLNFDNVTIPLQYNPPYVL